MGILSFIGAIVVFFWLIGLIFSLGGALIHLLLVVAAIVFIIDVLGGRKNKK